MLVVFEGTSPERKSAAGFTLTEVVMAIVLLALVIQGVIQGYIHASNRAEWNGRSLAAQSLALQATEQARAAKWDPQTWPLMDELPPTNFVTVDTLDIPLAGPPVYATNYLSITLVSANPALRQIRSDCVWSFPGWGTYTNSVCTLRAPDQ